MTEQAWQQFAAATAATFDGLITALGQPGLASSQPRARRRPTPSCRCSPPTATPVVQALLLNSPEPLPWRRMWQWTLLQPYGRAPPLTGITILWCTDQTRALIVPLGDPGGSYTLALGFEGNIGAEAPCITAQGASVTETADLDADRHSAPANSPATEAAAARRRDDRQLADRTQDAGAVDSCDQRHQRRAGL